MKIIDPFARIEDECFVDGLTFLRKIEKCGRICYRSEPKGDPEGFVRNVIKRKHFSLLEHCSLTCFFTTDRGVSHECVRHRLCVFTQESTRYCSYTDENGHKNEMTLICPADWDADEMNRIYSAIKTGQRTCADINKVAWIENMVAAERHYTFMINAGRQPQQARCVLPNSLATRFYWTANLREWRHILDLRACESTGSVHPDMKKIMVPLLKEFQSKIPVVFDDLILKSEKGDATSTFSEPDYHKEK